MKTSRMLPLRTFLLAYLYLSSAASRPTDVSVSNVDGAEAYEVKDLPPSREKYFSEPGGSLALVHYDSRYFTEEVDYAKQRPTLQKLMRSYLITMRSLGAETWLAHGTLLGWWWNGKIMPWDHDVDVQVSGATLWFLGAHHNNTLHEYRYVDEDTGEHKSRTYLLDINPHHVELQRNEGANIIDARWIDTDSGMYIDITGLAEREPDKKPGVWSCKNYHEYRTRDLYPMRETMFEGVSATVPYKFQRILADEYSERSMIETEHLGHRFEPDLKLWVKMER